MSIVLASPSFGGDNPNATFVLHAKSGFTGSCTVADQPNCLTARPSVTVEPNGDYRVFFYVNNINGMAAVQTAFEWDAAWELTQSSWSCRSNQLTVAAPDPSTNGGPTTGTLTTAFDCVTGPAALALIGFMDFEVGGSGCLSQVQSSYAYGNHVVDCANEIDSFDPAVQADHFGRVCVGGGGLDGCGPPTTLAVIGVNPPLANFGCVPVDACGEVTAQLSNPSPDPSSVLRVTQINVSGSEFGIASGPSLPVDIPADGTTIPLVMRFCPSVEGPVAGTLTVVAANATNSPHQVPLEGVGGAARSAVCVGGVLKDQFIIKFAQDAMVPPPDPSGPLDAFTFNVSGLLDELEEAGVVWLRKLMPWFTPESVHGTNALGEEILLEDSSTLYVATVGDGENALDAVYALEGQPGTLYVEPDHLFHALTVDDPLFQLQWGLDYQGIGAFPGLLNDTDIDAPEAWAIHQGGGGATVAVLDTGIDRYHPDLLNRIMAGFNAFNPADPKALDDDLEFSHGTAVAGIIGATTNNGTGVAGVSWGPRLVPVKVLDAFRNGSDSRVAAGIDWVRNAGIPIANLSVGSQKGDASFEAARNAALSGTFLVAATGNGDNLGVLFPASLEHITFAVGAAYGHDNNFTRTRWRDEDIPGCFNPVYYGSNFGPELDVLAPGGRGIITTKIDEYYDYDPCPNFQPCNDLCDAFGGLVGGTSAATGFVSGIAALLLDFDRNLIGEDFAEIMKQTAEDLYLPGQPGPDDESGYGLVNADRALKLINPYSPYLKKLEHAQLTPQEVDADYQLRTYVGVPGLPSHPLDTIRHRLVATHTFATPFLSNPPVVAWYRTSGTIGWLNDGPADDVTDYIFDPPSHARIVSLTNQSITLETYVFEVWDQNTGEHFGYFPPEPPRIAFTALGKIQSVIDVAENEAPIPVAYGMASPNPGHGHVRFVIGSPHPGIAALSIYDPLGRLVRTLSERLPAGESTLVWDGRNSSAHPLPSGVYFYRLNLNGDRVTTNRVLLLR